ncbi:DUF485 domain-containing protein [Jannaschia sp. R86511]|uniref:DUF485 domain-containing protein n=1 Tax=Jannaschia sp. R86511 TaxID=3093853 RepID=UPI0036D2D95A
MSTTHDPHRDQAPVPDGQTTWEEVQSSPEFQAMRRSFRRFVFPMTVAFLVWYFLYVLLAAYATDFFATPVFGNVNVGILFGLGQFVSTAAITIAYVRWANRSLDEKAAEIGAKVRLTEEGHR